AIISDGAGGAIISWGDYRNSPTGDIYAQRLSATGTELWTSGGVAVCTAPATQLSPAIATDGSSGCIIVWQDNRNGASDVYTQRVRPAGLIPTAVSEHTPSAGLTVRAAYPNPFSGKTGLDVVLSHQSAVTVEVFNVAGQRVRSIDEGSLSAGPSHLV